MNNEFSRMKSLLENLGLGFSENGITNAEIYAYSKGLELIKSYIQASLSEIFINIEENNNFSKYAALLAINENKYSNEELRKMIIQRLSQSFGDYTKSNFDEAFSHIGSGNYAITGNTIVFSNIKESDLKELGKFIESYVFLFTDVLFDGNGMTFDAWDNWAQNFYYYDNLGLPFNIIDNLRSEFIEQH